MAYSETEKQYLLQIGKAIRSYRERKGISQEKLAFMAGIDRSYMGAVERGERNVAVLNLRKIVHALGISERQLFDLLEE